MQIALDVLRACTDHTLPRPEDVAALQARLGAEAEGMSADDLARTIIEQYINESKSRGAARG